MIGFWPTFILVGFGLAGAIYIAALRLRLMAMVDLIWTFGLGLAGAAYFVFHDLVNVRSLMVLAIILVWSLRLSYYLLKDRVLKHEEDPRYQALATHWGDHARRNFLGLFLIQIPFIALFLLPVSTAMQNTSVLGWTDLLAVVIVIVALTGESIADGQLGRFRAEASNKGQVCKRGLWKYSRHPNYFFEWLHWWAYVAFAWNSFNWWLSLVGPIAMYIFLRYLTGIPHAERSSLKRRGEAYRTYQQTTSPFFPWIPRQPQP